MNRIYRTIGFICAGLSLVCLLVVFWIRNPFRQTDENTETVLSRVVSDLSVSAANISSKEDENEVVQQDEIDSSLSDPYESPVDFSALQEINPDVYAWLDIPGSEISYPILQHPEDDAYYLRRDIERNDAVEGVLFTEKTYNSTDFTDPVTIVYGHQMQSGTMFGKLQEIYSDPESFVEHQEIVVYLPDRENRYTVFAAVPYNKNHILYYFDFSNPGIYQAFIEHILGTRSLNAVFAEEISVTPDDRMLILSTCLKGNSNKRYLVLAVLQD